MKKWTNILIISLLLIETICIIVFGILAIKRGNSFIEIPDGHDYSKDGIYFFKEPTIQYNPNTLLWTVYLVMIGTVLLNLMAVYIIIKDTKIISKIIILIACILFFISTFFIPVIEKEQNLRYIHNYLNIYNMERTYMT